MQLLLWKYTYRGKKEVVQDKLLLAWQRRCEMVKLEKLPKPFLTVFCANFPSAKEVEHLYLWSRLALKKSADHKQLYIFIG